MAAQHDVGSQEAATMRILVAGAAGMIGSHLSRRLLERGHKVVGVDNFLTGHPRHLRHVMVHPGFRFVEADVCDELSDVGPLDAVCNLASPASPADFAAMPMEILRVGSLGSLRLLDLARDAGARYLLASTSEVYGEPTVHPQVEDYRGNVSTTGPRACYDEAKRFAEAAASSYERHFGVEVRIARIFNTYGPHMRPDDGRVVSNFCVQALEGRALTVHGDGRQTRSFCFVDDLVAGLEALLMSDVSGPVNLGNDHEIPVALLAEEVARLAGVPVRIDRRPLPPDEPSRRRPDATRARTLLDWQPRTTLADGLRVTLEWFRQLEAGGALADRGAAGLSLARAGRAP